MLKWLVKRKSTAGSMEGLDQIDGMFHCEGEPSPCTMVELDDLYKSFSDENEKRDSTSDDDADVFVVSPQKNRNFVRQKSYEQRHNSSSCILSCIEEGIESDELASIADSGISCDDDFDLDLDSKTKYSNNMNESKEKSYDFEDDTGGLLSSISEELFKRKDSIILSPKNKTRLGYRGNHEHVKNEEKPHITPKKTYIKTKSEEEVTKNEPTNPTSSSYSSTSSPEEIQFMIDTTQQYQPSFSDIDMANNQIFTRLKLKADLLNPTLNGKKSQKYTTSQLPHSLL